MTRELLVNGRLPHFEAYGDHIARYGKGFSQMLNLANVERMPTSGHNYSARVMNNSIHDHSSDDQEYAEQQARE